jgi:hypothetical protein
MKFIIGLIILGFQINACYEIIKSKSSDISKLLWCLLVLLFPIVGLIIWYFKGPKY